MPSPIQHVALLGASGIPGPAILNELLSSPLTVTVISHKDSGSTFPSRFVPSEFGVDTSNPALVSLVPFVAAKSQLVPYLRSKQPAISWTALVTGVFFDWGLWQGWLGIDLGGRKVKLWDGGETPFATMELDVVGRALVAVLGDGRAYEKAENGYVYVAGHVTTQKEVWAAVEKVAGEGFEVCAEVDAAAYGEKVHKEIAEGNTTNALDLLKVATFDKSRNLGVFPRYWNDDLGLRRPDLEQTVREVMEGKRKFTVSNSYENVTA